MNFIDRFLYKFLMLITILLIIIALDYFNFISINKLQINLSNNIHIMSYVSKLNGNSNLFDLGEDKEVEVSSIAHMMEKIEHGYRIYLDTYEGVENLRLGSVMKIEKINNKYNVYIESSDNITYCYSNLDTIDVHLYEIVKKDEIIGNVKEKEQKSYLLYLYKNNQYIDN